MQLAPFDRWPDIEVGVIAHLAEAMPGARVRAETGTGLAAPTVTVRRVPGGSTLSDAVSDGISDNAVVDIDVFGADRGEMWQLAAQAHAAILKLAAHAAKSGYIDQVDCESTFGFVDYGNPKLRRATATYRLTTRAQATV
jgi:hypothetical protein